MSIGNLRNHQAVEFGKTGRKSVGEDSRPAAPSIRMSAGHPAAGTLLMSSEQIREIQEYFPTEPWLQRYRDAIEASDAYAETGEDWGVDWNGAFIFQIEAIPFAERTLADLPEELVAGLDDRVRAMSDDEIETILEAGPDEVVEAVEAREGTVGDRALAELHATTLAAAPSRVWPELEAELPTVLRELLTQLDESVVDGDTVYAFLDVYDGGCREVEVLSSPDDRAHGFRLIGDYESWRSLVAGETGIIDLVMSGEFEVDGDMNTLLQYSDGAVALADIAADLETRFIL